MKKVIEVFRWGYEGEYEQVFFLVDSESDEKYFLKCLTKSMNTLLKTPEYEFSVPLNAMFPERQVQISFSNYSHIQHIKDRYVLVHPSEKGHTVRKW